MRENIKQMSEENSTSNSFRSKKSEVEWRRTIVLQRLSQGATQSQIARELKLHRSTISQDYKYLNDQSKKELRSFFDNRLPMEVNQAFASYDDITRVAWNTVNNTRDEKTKIQALHLIKETRDSRIELISNVPIATKVMDMAKQKSTEQEQEKETNLVAEEQEQEQELEQEE